MLSRKFRDRSTPGAGHRGQDHGTAEILGRLPERVESRLIEVGTVDSRGDLHPGHAQVFTAKASSSTARAGSCNGTVPGGADVPGDGPPPRR